ncbi:hypothetical protein [Thiomicrorhabdus heinhorstiae]|uniref:Transposase n=1 Tax=Thiomicrorhabdus heinhorstiae TaxID=2748010 RepID=A0ABS0BYX0_9GAMM|nr:hypothetical protein [Thiomicrorhabdus heinhorstiae]MBF6058992.1 hypothetical protein [Thiomicrorhabdus heinhorstiae]
MNPVRAGMVESPDQYAWSSYLINALGKASELCTPHTLYLMLGNSKASRQSSYRGLFQELLEEPLLDEIRQMTNKSLALGSERFKSQIEKLTKRRVHPKARGRQTGWRKIEI